VVAQLLPWGSSECEPGSALCLWGEMERSRQVTPVLLYQKTAMHMDAGGTVYLELGTYAMWLPHGFGHCKELYHDANMQRPPGKRSGPVLVPLLPSLTVHVLIPRSECC